MIHKGLKHTTTTYYTILSELYWAKKVDVIHEKMINDGVAPDIITYHTILDGLGKNMCMDEAMNLFKSISFQGFRPDIESFSILMDGMLRVGKTEEAKHLFNSIFAKGLVPDVLTYTTIAKCLIKEGTLEEVDELFSSMDKYGCSSDSIMFNVIVRGLLQKGEIKKAMEFLYKMDEQKFLPEASTSSLLLDLLSEEEHYHKYMKLIPDFSRHFTSSTDEIRSNSLMNLAMVITQKKGQERIDTTLYSKQWSNLVMTEQHGCSLILAQPKRGFSVPLLFHAIKVMSVFDIISLN